MKKVLVLDDDADILDVVKEVLTYEKFEVHAINKAKNVSVVVETYRPDLILMDFRLADGDGGNICQELKSHSEFKHLPVILFSAYINSEAESELFKYGCDAVIAKPFDLTKLVGTINQLIQ